MKLISYENKLKKAIAFLLLSSSLGIKFLFIIYLTYSSSSKVVSIYAILASTEAICIYLAGLEFHTFTSRRYAKKSGKKIARILIKQHLGLLILTTFIASLAGFIIVSVALNLELSQRIYFSLIIITGVLLQEIGRYLIVLDFQLKNSIYNFTRIGVWPVLSIIFIYNNCDSLKSVIYSWLAVNIGIITFFSFDLKYYLTATIKVKRNYIITGIKKSLPYYTSSLFQVIQTHIDKYVILLFLGHETLSSYFFFQSLCGVVLSINQSVTYSMKLPVLLNAFSKKSDDKFKILKNTEMEAFLIAAFFSILILITVLTSVKLEILEKSYTNNYWIVIPLLFIQTINSITQCNHLALYADGHDSFLFKTSIVAFIFGTLLMIVLTSIYNIIGLLISQMLISIYLFLTKKLMCMNLLAYNKT